ncbi:protein of unknown function [Agrobacterium pusense]|uniref:Uncharacterized protein n=1 Tax=Agrobacterium pusense TaxID=648995 RepID=U4Q7V0_9HYPH|nr:protein of unknown function [Agrobacterium pusense]
MLYLNDTTALIEEKTLRGNLDEPVGSDIKASRFAISHYSNTFACCTGPKPINASLHVQGSQNTVPGQGFKAASHLFGIIHI